MSAGSGSFRYTPRYIKIDIYVKTLGLLLTIFASVIHPSPSLLACAGTIIAIGHQLEEVRDDDCA